MKLVEGWPAIIIEKPDPAIIVSDIHYGFEVDLNDRGIRIPSQTMKITSSLMKLVKENGVQKVIILGDLKHKIPKSSRIEWGEMPRALKSLIEAGIEVHLIPGNHDGGIRKILGNLVSYSPSSGLFLEGEKKFFMFHGHRWPDTCILESDMVLIGHLHPMVNLRTDLGYFVKKPVWLILEGDKNILAKTIGERYGLRVKGRGKIEMIILPAFNPMITGISVNNPDPSEKLWPLIKSGSFILDEAEIVLLDGQNLGRLKEIQKIVEE